MKLSIKLSATKKLYVILGATVVAIAAVVFFAVFPLVTKVSELNQSVKDNQVQIEIFQRERENLETTQREYNTIKNDVSELEALFTESGSFLNIITELEQLAIRTNVTQNIQVPQSTATGPFAGTITLQCTWNNCLSYLAAIEELDYYLAFNDMSISQENDSLTIVVNAQTYAKK